ncbi:MAG: MFS transporter [Acetobacteraceae bacterium]|nr:MFS transporter [Acetobacteraceae bacterium]
MAKPRSRLATARRIGLAASHQPIRETLHAARPIALMSPKFTAFAPILLGIASAQVAQGLLGPLIPLLLVEQGVPTAQIGMVASAHSAGFLIGSLYCTRLIPRLGHGRAFVAFAVAAADAILLMAIWQSPLGWAILRAIAGMAYAGMCIVAESWLNARANNQSRGRVFGLYMVASWGGGLAGPLILSVLPPTVLMFAGAGMAYATALLPVALVPPITAPTRIGPRMGLLSLWRISPVGLACGLSAGLANSTFYALTPVYLQRLDHDTVAVGMFALVANIAGLLVQMPAGMLSDRVGRRPVALAALFGPAAAAIGFLVAGPAALPVLLVLGALLAGLAAPLYGLGAGLTNDRLDSEDAVAAAGAMLLAWSVGATIGPSAGGFVMHLLGPPGLFWYLASVFGAMALFTVWRMLLRAEVPRDQRTTFVPAASPPPRLPATLPEPETP